MRPTWHLVAAEDIRWMLKLSAKRIQSANKSLGKIHEIEEATYTRCNCLIEKMLEGQKHLTKQEIGEKLKEAGIAIDETRVTRFIMRAETEGIVCNGIDQGRKTTYALLEERVLPTKELHPEEALAKLALLYFRSHSPATLADFIWWSGLSAGEAKQAVGAIESELIRESYDSKLFFIHQSCQTTKPDDILHFLPPYDEYLISYTDRTAMLASEHTHKAFTNFGIFHPVIMHNGKIIGNWDRTVKKGSTTMLPSFFEQTSDHLPLKEPLQNAADRYLYFRSH